MQYPHPKVNFINEKQESFIIVNYTTNFFIKKKTQKP
jgi:hypothetical protein